MPYGTASQRTSIRSALLNTWRIASKNEGHGEWVKILKRIYRYGARARCRFLRKRVTRDILTYPSLTRRICEYLFYTSTVTECVHFARSVLEHPEQVYPDVSYQILDWLLQLEPKPSEANSLRRLFRSIAKQEFEFSGRIIARSLDPMALLRYGDKRSLKSLVGRLGDGLDKVSVEELRSISIVLAGFGEKECQIIQATASRLLINHLSEFVRMVQRIREFTTVPDRFKARIKLSKDSITFRQYVDMRTILTMRLLRLNRHVEVRQWLANKKTSFLSAKLSDFDKKFIMRVLN